MRRMILVLPLVAISIVACNRNNEQAGTSGPSVATAQGPGTTSPNTGAPPNGADTSGTATGSSAAGQGATGNPPPDNNSANPGR